MRILYKTVIVAAFLFIGAIPVTVSFAQAPQLGKDPINKVVQAMTLQEKAKVVVGMGWDLPPLPPGAPVPAWLKNRKIDPDAKKFPPKVQGAAGRTHPIPRLGIPIMTLSDGPAGVRINPYRNFDSTRTYFATGWPVATLLASSWDTTLVQKVGVAFGSEVHDYGIDVLLAPALNIHRNPLGGRNFEYYSEDPLIAGKMASAIVKGVQSNGVGTSIKHFDANNQETSRNSVNTIVSERALREIYLKGFEIAVKDAQPWTVMSSYNKINGTYTSQRHDLLTTVLRDEWGFKGFVMTDWTGGDDPVAQMKAGNDMLQPGNLKQMKTIVDAVKSGKLSEKILDQNVERILRVELMSPAFKKYNNSDKPNLQKDAQIAREAGSQGMILLKNNDNALPLKNDDKVALFGNTSYDIIPNGTGSGDVHKPFVVQLYKGLSDAGYTVDASLQDSYEMFIKYAKARRPKPKSFFQAPPPIAEMTVTSGLAALKANTDDIAIITIGRNAGEGRDRKLKDDFYLSDAEKALIHNVSQAFHAKGKKVVVVLNTGGVMEVATWRDEVDGILLAWQPGEEAGNSISDVLSGKINPSGKLTTTIPMKYDDEPSAKNFPGTPEKKPEQVIYKEGIYVGYRYFNTFNVKPAYEFGYGLSYTTFKFDNLKLSSKQLASNITATVDVTNSGSAAGKEVVQLYISAPAKELNKPSEELRGFAKTKLLQPGETQTITFTIKPSDLSSYNTATSSWIDEAGTYTVKIGASSLDIRQTDTFDLSKDIVVEKDTKVLTPQVKIDEMK